VAVREGSEPSDSPLESTNNQSVGKEKGGGWTQIGTQTPDSVWQQLSQVVVAWPLLSLEVRPALVAVASFCSRSTRNEKHPGGSSVGGSCHGKEVSKCGENS